MGHLLPPARVRDFAASVPPHDHDRLRLLTVCVESASAPERLSKPRFHDCDSGCRGGTSCECTSRSRRHQRDPGGRGAARGSRSDSCTPRSRLGAPGGRPHRVERRARTRQGGLGRHGECRREPGGGRADRGRADMRQPGPSTGPVGARGPGHARRCSSTRGSYRSGDGNRPLVAAAPAAASGSACRSDRERPRVGCDVRRSRVLSQCGSRRSTRASSTCRRSAG